MLGLGLCPFAAEPWHAGQVRLVVSEAASEQQLLEDLRIEVVTLDEKDPKLLETTLRIIPSLLRRFDGYNQFLDLSDELFDTHGWTGCFQVASFHPDYQFQGTKLGDPENLTNRSPCPLLHVLRESTVSRALEEHLNFDHIPSTNIVTLRALSDERRRELFGHFPIS